MPQALSEDKLIGCYTGNRVEGSAKMVWAHHDIPRLRLVRLCFDLSKNLSDPTLLSHKAGQNHAPVRDLLGRSATTVMIAPSNLQTAKVGASKTAEKENSRTRDS